MNYFVVTENVEMLDENAFAIEEDDFSFAARGLEIG